MHFTIAESFFIVNSFQLAFDSIFNSLGGTANAANMKTKKEKYMNLLHFVVDWHSHVDG